MSNVEEILKSEYRKNLMKSGKPVWFKAFLGING